MGCRTGDILELFSLKDMYVEQKCYLFIMARRIEVSATLGKQNCLLSGLCGGVVRGFIILLGPRLYSRKSARDKLEGIKKSLIVLEYRFHLSRWNTLPSLIYS